jgi:hypothetical protein
MVHMRCPDRQILSVYLDGELPSPWKEKMEAHLGECPQCREKLEAFQGISRALEGSGAARAAEAARERVWAAITQNGLPGNPAIRRHPSLWRRTVSVPLPAAALAAAAAVFIIVFAAAWTRSAVVPLSPDAGPVLSDGSSGIDLDLQGIMPVSDISGVLQYLGNTDAGDIVIIHLPPDSGNFRSFGEPTIIKASDYTGSRPQR